MIRSTIDDHGRTVIPPEVREALGLGPQQGLVYEIHGRSVTLRTDRSDLSRLGGSLATDRAAMSKQQARDAARRAAAERNT